MATFPINKILHTVEGEGELTGRATVVVRFGFSSSISYLHLKPGDFDYPVENLTINEILAFVDSVDTDYVHLVGADPLFQDGIGSLIDTLTLKRRVIIDTSGLFFCASLEKAFWVSVGVKPDMRLDPRILEIAKELRFYLSNGDYTNCLENIARVEPPNDNCVMSIMPYSESEDMEIAMKFVMENKRYVVALRPYKVIDKMAAVLFKSHG